MAESRQIRRRAVVNDDDDDGVDSDRAAADSPMKLLKTILVNQDKLGSAQVLAMQTLISLKKSVDQGQSAGNVRAGRQPIPLDACFTKVKFNYCCICYSIYLIF
jgi:hypothetical protein